MVLACSRVMGRPSSALYAPNRRGGPKMLDPSTMTVVSAAGAGEEVVSDAVPAAGIAACEPSKVMTSAAAAARDLHLERLPSPVIVICICIHGVRNMRARILRRACG